MGNSLFNVSTGILSIEISSSSFLLSWVDSFSQDVDFGLSSGISLGSTMNDGREVTSPRSRRWKCLARKNVAILNTESSLSEFGKRDSELNMEDYQGKKRGKCMLSAVSKVVSMLLLLC
ncbi:hypothetical protein ACOSP7_032110 [Xanthoceras sorbifolium]